MLSLLAIERVALWMPPKVGVQVITKVVDAPGPTEAAGCVVTTKSAELPPPITTRGVPERPRLSLAMPLVFLIVKVLAMFPAPTVCTPKKVKSSVRGVASPSRISRLLPRIWISAAWADELK